MLSPPLELALRRDRARGHKEVGHIWRHLDAVMRKQMDGVGLWLDNSTLTPDETVEAIIERADEGVVLETP